MSESSSQRVSLRSRENIGTVVPRNFARENYSKFGRVVVALWPEKPGLNLAQRAGCSERHANLVIAGHRKPNAYIAAIVFAEAVSAEQ